MASPLLSHATSLSDITIVFSQASMHESNQSTLCKAIDLQPLLAAGGPPVLVLRFKLIGGASFISFAFSSLLLRNQL
jgi:hypothetical protein